MAQQWTGPRPHCFHEACLDWSRLIGMRRAMLPPETPERGPEYAPLFVRLRTNDSPVAARKALLELVRDRTSPFLMDSAEAAALSERITGPCDLDGLPDEYMIYGQIGAPARPDLFVVLDRGMPVEMPGPDPDLLPVPEVMASPRPGAPLVAVIDDGIGFLNARFRRATAEGHRTRFHALWLQSLHQFSSAPRGTASGQVLDAEDIDAMIANGDERACYAWLNEELFPGDSRRETGVSTTHGTHVLDLAAGADPESGDPVSDWPLLGVQLPPESIDDTSGTMFESYLVMAMRWILRQARKVDRTAPVIVNVSLGVLAGPKDGTRFAEYQMAREAHVWQEATDQPVHLVWAFGNDYRSSQVARMTLSAETPPQDITWRALPDDETASYIEIHCRGGRSDKLKIGLTTPSGDASGLEVLAPGEIRSLERPDGAALARIYHVPDRALDPRTTCPSHYVLALAPTRGQKMQEPEAAPGAWTVTVSADDTVDVLLQVQRDDSIRGSGIRGRQSYLDHPDAYTWDSDRAAYVKPTRDGPICDDGTHSAFVTVADPQVLSTGAARLSARVDQAAAENYRAAAYSGQGAEWSVAGPDASTVAAYGAFFPGVRGAGTYSGSTRRLGGTSAAAGRHSRALALAAAGAPPTRIAMDDDRLGKAVILVPDVLPPC